MEQTVTREQYDKLLKNYEKALRLLTSVLKNDDFICERLSCYRSEDAYCEAHCNNLSPNCVERYLKYYE